METYEDNFYTNLRSRISGQGNKYSHDEERETQMVSELKAFRESAKNLYIRSVLNPECHVAKVPSRMPVESAVASLRYNLTITPNASGKFLLVIDPFYSQGYLYQDATVNGNGAGVVTNVTFAQDPALIDQWRLVSSSVILKYYGNFNQMSGLFVAATTSNVSAATATTYLTFSNVEDLTNKQVLKCIDGVKMVYSPMDEKATEFQNISSYTGGTHPCRWQYLFVIYGDLFPNAGFIRCDFFRNIEYTTTPSYKEYVTQTKDLPSDTVIPNIKSTVSSAPRDFTGQVGTQNTVSWTDEVKAFAHQALKDTVGNVMKEYNPLAFNKVQGQFDTMKNLGILGGWK